MRISGSLDFDDVDDNGLCDSCGDFDSGSDSDVDTSSFSKFSFRNFSSSSLNLSS